MAVKNSKSPITSDVDVWFFVPSHRVGTYSPEFSLSVAKLYFGEQVDFHIMAAPEEALAKISSLGECIAYTPN